MVEPSDHIIVITMRDLWDGQQEMVKAVAQMNAKLDGIVFNAAQVGTTIKDHESRIRELEKFAWKAAGIGGVSGALLGAIAAALINALFSK